MQNAANFGYIGQVTGGTAKLGSYLENEKTSVEVARVDENSAELPTLEQLVGVLEEDVIGINHDDTLVVNQGPRVKLVQRQLEPPVDPS